MNDTIYIAGVVLTLAASGLVAWTLHRPLRSILTELCGTAERAVFWVALTRIVLMTLPAIFALAFPPDPAEGTSAVVAVATQLKWGLIGVVTVAGALGLMLAAFIPSRTAPPVPAPAPSPAHTSASASGTAHAHAHATSNPTIAEGLEG